MPNPKELEKLRERINKDFDELYIVNANNTVNCRKHKALVTEFEMKEFAIYEVNQAFQERDKLLVEFIEGAKKEILALHYSDVEPKLDYKLQVHEQTLKIGFNQGLEKVKSIINNIEPK